MIENVVFFLEEPSAEDFLRGILPGLLPASIALHFLVFEGKQDLEKQLSRRMRGWQRPNSRFIVIRDQDSGDCVQIKGRLKALCEQAGRTDAVVRIACTQLEAFFIGDWHAVAEAFDREALRSNAGKAKYRTPDSIGDPARELQRVIPTYQKRDGARRIAPRLVPDRNQSKSFGVLIKTLRQIAS